MTERYIGLISGTSVDGIDAVLVDFSGPALSLDAVFSHPYPDSLQSDLRRAMREPGGVGLDALGDLHVRVGESFRDAVLALLDTAGVAAADIAAIGSHGQTIRHRPDAAHPFTLQIGDAATIAAGTGIDTVADFRSADVALGGEGAPLVPPFHAWLLQDPGESRVVLNIGGIANITVLPADGSAITGFDTGPGNTLLDAWVSRERRLPFDDDGRWAASGSVNDNLVQRCLADPYFAATPPKSTGFEMFNLDWLLPLIPPGIGGADVQASLAEVTARGIADAIGRWAPGTRCVYMCGGGSENGHLCRRLQDLLGDVALRTTNDAGVPPAWVEAAAFAWLARRHRRGEPGNLPAVTGARRPAILGALYPAQPNVNS